VRVRCSIGHAFAVFTQGVDTWWPKGHRRFADSRLVLEARVGGRFFERSTGGEEAALGEVLACEPPHSISYSWRPGAIDQPTRVDIRFTQEGAETVVHVVHSEGESGLGEAWPERVVLFERGWQIVLLGFTAKLEDEGAALSRQNNQEE
jgi:uncharacterized protein YndB with AHSA1/START domain